MDFGETTRRLLGLVKTFEGSLISGEILVISEEVQGVKTPSKSSQF